MYELSEVTFDDVADPTMAERAANLFPKLAKCWLGMSGAATLLLLILASFDPLFVDGAMGMAALGVPALPSAIYEELS